MTREPSDAAIAVSQLRSIVQGAEGLLQQDVESISVLLDAGELKVALEHLCTQIYEYDVEVSASLRAILEGLGTSFDVPVAYLLGDPWAASPGPAKS